MNSKPKILECTLRDGSYEINFQFTRKNTLDICSALDAAGFELIEVGHGVGLGASEKNIGVAAECDETYMQAAAETVKNGKWGMFAIPGIAELSHLKMAQDHGMDFIRIGSPLEDFHKSTPFIDLARKQGMMTCVNFMKSYAEAPAKLAEAAVTAFKQGVDVVYVVDSAGGMLPDEVARYVHEIKDRYPEGCIGFHGHNNLGLGIGNALAALEAGAEIVDTSLQGFGRSAGNTTTEQMLACLARMGLQGNIDPIKVMDMGEELIKPLIEKRGQSSLDTVCGMALFHSSYMPLIQQMSVKYRIDPRLLIVSVCSEDIVHAEPEVVERHAKQIAESKKNSHGWKPHYKNYFINEHAQL